jgi:hypothetical protein
MATAAVGPKLMSGTCENQARLSNVENDLCYLVFGKTKGALL